MNKVILFLSAVVVSFSALVATAASLNYEEAMSKGRVAFNDGRIEDALRYFELALEDDMNTPHEREQAKTEIRRCQDILEQRNGVDADARFQDGLISAQQLLMNKKYAECKSKCEELLRIYPNRADELEPLLSRCNAYFAERQAEANAAAEKERQYKVEFSELQYLIIDEKWQEAKNRCETMLSKYPEHKTELKQLCDKCNIGLGVYGYVDLGLSVLWADRNIGAFLPNEIGYYYAWGELLPFSNAGYSFAPIGLAGSNFLYIGDEIANTQYDVAHQEWGEDWMIPNKYHWKELIDKCEWIWMNNGFQIIGPNGNRVFIPATGAKSTSRYFAVSPGIWTDIDYCCYWSSTGDKSKSNGSAYAMTGREKDSPWVHCLNRSFGFAVRPVRRK